MKFLKRIIFRIFNPLRSTYMVFGYFLKGVYIHPFSKLCANVKIGKGTNIAGPIFIEATDSANVVIGKFCAIAHGVRIRAVNHNYRYLNMQHILQNRLGLSVVENSRGNVEIGNGCWIGDNVLILPGVIIGDGCVIGAGSIVTKNIESYSIVAGNPAKVLGKRFDERMCQRLESLDWWNWDIDSMKRNIHLFESELTARTLSASHTEGT